MHGNLDELLVYSNEIYSDNKLSGISPRHLALVER